MDDFGDILEKHSYVHTLKSHCSRRYNLTALPESEYLGETLTCLQQEESNVTQKLLSDLEEQIILQELGKHPNEWLTTEQAENSFLESEQLLKEVEDISVGQDKNHQETFEISSDALKTLKEKLSILENKILELSEKMTNSKVSKALEKESLLLSTAIAERQLALSHFNSLQGKIESLQAIAAKNHEQEVALAKVLKKIQANLDASFEQYGISCNVLSETSLEVTFETEAFKHLNTKMSDLDVTLDELKLTATLSFSKQGQLLDVELNQTIDAKTIIATALADNNVSRLVLELHKLWSSQTRLVAEISLLRNRHAIDWLPEKNTLLLIVKKVKNCVCTIKVPSTYPHSGEIVLENVMGHPSGLTADEVMPPTDTTLIGWLEHLDNFFGQV